MSNEPLPVPEDIEQKISELASKYAMIPAFAGGERFDQRRCIDYIAGATGGYSLAASQISLQKAEIETLEQTIVDYDKQVIELKRELEELRNHIVRILNKDDDNQPF